MDAMAMLQSTTTKKNIFAWINFLAMVKKNITVLGILMTCYANTLKKTHTYFFFLCVFILGNVWRKKNINKTQKKNKKQKMILYGRYFDLHGDLNDKLKQRWYYDVTACNGGEIKCLVFIFKPIVACQTKYYDINANKVKFK